MNSRRIMNENNPKKDTGQKKYKRRKSADGNTKHNDDNNTRKQKDKSKHRSPRGRGGGGGGGGSGGGGNGNDLVSKCISDVGVIKTNPFLVALLSNPKPEPIKNNGNGNTTIPSSNVFLNNHYRNNSSFQKNKRHDNNNNNNDSSNGSGSGSGNGSGDKINYFIHNSSIQNDRRRGGGGSDHTNAFRRGVAVTEKIESPIVINTNDTEQFPILGGVAKSSSNNKVMNFKDIIMKQSVAPTVSVAPVGSVAPPVSEASVTRGVVYSRPSVPLIQPLQNLSRGNIFLGAFYKSRRGDGDGDDGDGDGDDDGNGDDGYNGNGNGDSGGYGFQRQVITSTLVDNCDSSYDKLYK